MTNVLSAMDVKHRNPGSIDRTMLAECIEACFDCAERCTACADACLNEDVIAKLAKCIGTNLDCVDICTATGRVLSRQRGAGTDAAHAVLEACRRACKACADECGQYASTHGHCELCVEACRGAERACAELLALLS